MHYMLQYMHLNKTFKQIVFGKSNSCKERHCEVKLIQLHHSPAVDEAMTCIENINCAVFQLLLPCVNNAVSELLTKQQNTKQTVLHLAWGKHTELDPPGTLVYVTAFYSDTSPCVC